MYCMSILRVHTLHNEKSAKKTTLRVVPYSPTSLLPFETRISCAPTAFPKYPARSRSFSESESVESEAQLALDTTPPSLYSPTSPLPKAPRARRRRGLQFYSLVRNWKDAPSEDLPKAHRIKEEGGGGVHHPSPSRGRRTRSSAVLACVYVPGSVVEVHDALSPCSSAARALQTLVELWVRRVAFLKKMRWGADF